VRQWNIKPSLLCRKHLLGEHVECHMLAGAIAKGKNIDGFINGGLVEVHNTRNRHDELVEEMKRRGYNHKSPLPEFKEYHAGNVSVSVSLADLSERCPDCRKRIASRPLGEG